MGAGARLGRDTGVTGDRPVIRVPSASEYAALPYEERRRMLDAIRDLIAEWARTEAIR